ncbi:MAG: hypothetical protein INR73_27805 [Williamsia sp.]|nr:hypothetical protein [Williamsia sp.]
MARIPKGILGPLSGSVGTVVGASWKGINYIRSKPIDAKRESTVDQLDHQLKFSTVVGFVQPLTAVVEITYKKYAVGMSEYNAAFSYNYANALAGVTPDYTIDYAKALVSRGDLPNAVNMKASITGTDIFFTWEDNSGVGKAATTDMSVIVAYCPELSQTLFSNLAATRSAGAATLKVADFVDRTVQTWLSFVSKDGKEASNSFYTGELVVK